jgi:hypothetical protein
MSSQLQFTNHKNLFHPRPQRVLHPVVMPTLEARGEREAATRAFLLQQEQLEAQDGYEIQTIPPTLETSVSPPSASNSSDCTDPSRPSSTEKSGTAGEPRDPFENLDAHSQTADDVPEHSQAYFEAIGLLESGLGKETVRQRVNNVVWTAVAKTLSGSGILQRSRFW